MENLSYKGNPGVLFVRTPNARHHRQSDDILPAQHNTVRTGIPINHTCSDRNRLLFPSPPEMEQKYTTHINIIYT